MEDEAAANSRSPRVTVFMPSTILTITVEAFGGGRENIEQISQHVKLQRLAALNENQAAITPG